MKRNMNEDIDNKITQFFMDETENISIPQDSFYKIKSGILREKERGFLNMKFGFLKAKTVIAAGLICMTAIGTVGVGASSGLFWTGGSDVRQDLKEFPSEDIVEKRVGFSPKYVDSFSNGFKFDSFNSSHSDLKNDNKDTITSVKSAEFRYKKDGSSKNQKLLFAAEKVEEKYTDLDDTDNAYEEYNGMKIYYHANKYKAVPEDYKVTDEEQKMIDDGSLQVGYGADKIEEDNIQSVAWYEDGIKYLMMVYNHDELTKTDIVDMAKQVIDK